MTKVLTQRQKEKRAFDKAKTTEKERLKTVKAADKEKKSKEKIKKATERGKKAAQPTNWKALAKKLVSGTKKVAKISKKVAAAGGKATVKVLTPIAKAQAKRNEMEAKGYYLKGNKWVKYKNWKKS